MRGPRASSLKLAIIVLALLDLQAQGGTGEAPQRPRLALCITGQLQYWNCGYCAKAHFSTALYSPDQIERLRSFHKIMSEHGVDVDYHVYVDPRSYPEQNSADKKGEHSVSAPVHSTVTEKDMEKVHAVRKSGLPIATFELHTAEPLCPKWPVCGCSTSDVAWPRWFEQAYKNERCYEQIQKHELSYKFRYPWVARVRSDLDVLSTRPTVLQKLRTINDIPEPEDIARLIHLDSPLPIAYVKGTASFPGYGMIDHFWLVRRDYADITFALTANLTCSWIAEFLKSCRTNTCMPNERLQVDWQASHGVISVPVGHASMSVMFPDSSLRSTRMRRGRDLIRSGNTTKVISNSTKPIQFGADVRAILNSTITKAYSSLQTEFEARSPGLVNKQLRL
jgi:hypothetical protein